MSNTTKTGNGSVRLSVCIPTYNRPKQIERLLKEIVPQLRPEVEIVIRDDSSNPETEKIVADYLKKYPITYFHGERLGYDRSILFLVEKARGEYVWFFGDDEMGGGAIEHVLRSVDRFKDLSLLYLNSRSSMDANQRAFDFNNDFFFKDGSDVLEKIGELLTFPSALILKRGLIGPKTYPPERYIGSTLTPFYLALKTLSGPGRYYFVNEPFVVTDPKMPDEPLWYDSFQVSVVHLSNIIQEFSGQFSGKTVKNLLKRHFGRILRAILVYRSKGYTHDWGSRSIKVVSLFKFFRTFPEFWLALPFLMMPRYFLKPAYRIYKFFDRNK